MLDEWQVPQHPEQMAADQQRRRRLLWGWAGALIGCVANLGVLALVLGPLLSADLGQRGLAGLAVAIYTALASAVLLVASGLLCIGHRVRPFGVGLLIGTVTGLIVSNVVSWTILAVFG